jgi:hypothetical protein
MSETQVLQTIDNIANRLAAKFKFGYHEIEDMKQQARLFAWEGLNNYDGVRPLENFLWTHVRNRLYNFKRNNFGRPDKPCDTCPFFDRNFLNSRGYSCKAYDNHEECDLYSGWVTRNTAKRNIMNTSKLDLDIQDQNSVENTFDRSDIFNLVDSTIPVQYREDWIRLTNDLKLPKARKEIVVAVVLEILKEHKFDQETW